MPKTPPDQVALASGPEFDAVTTTTFSLAEPPGSSDARNVYERKLAVMARCKDIVPDKVHPHHKFQYNSIQQISNRLREYAVAEQLDISVDFPPEHDGYVRVRLSCSGGASANGPETAVAYYPVTPDDKGLAYSTKYALIRLFLIGDGEENDEAEMADRSSAKAPQRAVTPAKVAAKETPASPQSEALTDAVRALREEGKVTEKMLALLRELGIGSNKRVSELAIGEQVYLLRSLLAEREKVVDGKDLEQLNYEKLLAEITEGGAQ
jgi:hypothetical protein